MGGTQTISGVSSSTLRAPSSLIPMMISLSRMRTVLTTPAAPYAYGMSAKAMEFPQDRQLTLCAYKKGRPSPTAFAPRQSALSTSAEHLSNMRL